MSRDTGTWLVCRRFQYQIVRVMVKYYLAMRPVDIMAHVMRLRPSQKLLAFLISRGPSVQDHHPL